MRYAGSGGGNPTSAKYPNPSNECTDEPLSSLVPVAPMNATSKNVEVDYDVDISANSASLYRWYLAGSTFEANHSAPTLGTILHGNQSSIGSSRLTLDVSDANEWVYIVMESPIGLPHPIHLHGHDFFVLAAGPGSYTRDTRLQLTNPPRRDTALMPAAGFLVVAFETDNPGVWLMHCHIGWHLSMGFALQIVERRSEIASTVHDQQAMQDTCASWIAFTQARGIQNQSLDSGV